MTYKHMPDRPHKDLVAVRNRLTVRLLLSKHGMNVDAEANEHALASMIISKARLGIVA